MALRNKELHLKYWVGILMAIIVLLISTFWYDIPNLGDRLIFALTLASVLLAILAIFFTLNFNTLFSNNVVKLLSINDKIEESASKLFQVNKRLDEKLKVIPDSIGEIDKKIETTNELIESRLSYEGKKPTEKVEWDADKFSLFFIKLSFLGMIYMYLIATYYKNNKPISRKLFDNPTFIGFEYFVGFLIPLKSIDLSEFYYQKESSEIIVTKCDQVFLDEIDNIFDWVIEYYESEGDKKQSEYLKKSKQLILDNL